MSVWALGIIGYFIVAVLVVTYSIDYVSDNYPFYLESEKAGIISLSILMGLFWPLPYIIGTIIILLEDKE